MANSNDSLTVGRVDWWSVAIYLALVCTGWLNIYAAVWDDGGGGVLDMGSNYGKQLMWIGICLFLATAIMLIDDKYYHMLAYPAYWIAILILVAVLFVGSEVKGARSWIMLGPVALQPTELVKFTTALGLARYMSRYGFSIHRFRDVAGALAIVLLPVAVILLQNDLGSALVYGAFLIPLYREGLNHWIYVGLAMALLLFIGSLMLEPFTVLVGIILVCTVGEGLANGRWKKKAVYLATIALGTIALYSGLNMAAGIPFSLFHSLLAVSLASIVMVVGYAYRHRLRNALNYVALFIASLAFATSVDYVFDNVLQEHQQKRTLDFLGIEKDLVRWGYNANQSKIAIGSGGFTGKGFLAGTQTKYDFVPEQSTDFIFATVGEEWGFAGTFIVTGLFCVLILRLVRMGERRGEAFGRVYCYSVAAIFFVHVLINIGMTIGIMPVIGIPLPFFSYGGSSLLAFTLLLFVAVKLDSTTRDTPLIY